MRPKIETNTLIDEFQRVSLPIVGVGFHDPDLHHLIEEVLDALVGHRADAVFERVPGVDDAVFLEFSDRERYLLVAEVRIRAFVLSPYR